MHLIRNKHINIWSNRFFGSAQQEVDYIEEKDGLLNAFEVECEKTRKNNQGIYKCLSGKATIITPENFMEFITS